MGNRKGFKYSKYADDRKTQSANNNKYNEPYRINKNTNGDKFKKYSNSKNDYGHYTQNNYNNQNTHYSYNNPNKKRKHDQDIIYNNFVRKY
jgi:hypothetical protein